MEKIEKDIYKITLPTPFLVGPINTYLIKGQALTLVDTGPNTEEAFQVLESNLMELCIELKDIEIVILTHHHPDHIGLLEKFLPHAKVYAHPKVKPWLDKDPKFLEDLLQFYGTLYESHGVPEKFIREIEKKKKGYLHFSSGGHVDKELLEGSEIEGLSEWSVIETPGHAQSHISLYRHSDGVMLAGDHIIEHISSNAIIEAPYGENEERPKTLLQYRESLEKCAHAKIAYSGHGKAVENPKKLIGNRLVEQDKKGQKFKQLMGRNPITAFELCKRKYLHIFEQQPDLTFSETLGHLDVLEENGEVRQVLLEGIIHYQVI
ncbi:MBL fold metallo-hydrolase [Evansella sp. AB-P1]|uniref:MBL fold metallo-hydrolase n=1 Tax=Evansella sp. AB-P1 TaxID=3037653 RepID=UPI00241D13C5|nr:MBL fold metallo-hydrolase [Evansella sp. AB-P1]MDG5786116.1 MBL fold metallo-hydrolase [Evansella sp. AB-P1]